METMDGAAALSPVPERQAEAAGPAERPRSKAVFLTVLEGKAFLCNAGSPSA